MRVRFVFITNHTLVLGSGRRDVISVVAKGLHGFPFPSSLFFSSQTLWSCYSHLYSKEISRMAVM